MIIKPFFVGLAGPDGVGKSTVQKELVKFDYRWTSTSPVHLIARPMSFAARLYTTLSVFLGVPVAVMKARKDEILTAETAPLPAMVGKTYRWVLRHFATEFVRDKLHPDYWVQCVVQDAPKLLKSEYVHHVVVILDDLRFVNEATLAGAVIELSKEGVGYDGEHASSRGLPPEIERAYVSNDGSPEDTARRCVEYIIPRLLASAPK